METPLTFTTFITLDDYRKFHYYLFYRKPLMIGISLFGLLMWLVIPLYFINPELTYGEFPLTQTFIALMITVGLPLFLFWNTSRVYKSNAKFREEIRYILNESWLTIEGNNFVNRIPWDEIHKIVETKSWFVIYQDKLVAHLLIKQNLTDLKASQFRNFIAQMPSVKSKLRA